MNTNNTQDEIRCPKCGSSNIHAEKRGFNIWTGMLGSGKIVITCLACAHKFKPGEGLKVPQVAAEQVKPKRKEVEDDDGIPTYRLD